VSGLHLEVREFETLDWPPRQEWAWTIHLDGKVIDHEAGFETEADAESHGKCMVRNYEDEHRREL
jgi:hypothetical protein